MNYFTRLWTILKNSSGLLRSIPTTGISKFNFLRLLSSNSMNIPFLFSYRLSMPVPTGVFLTPQVGDRSTPTIANILIEGSQALSTKFLRDLAVSSASLMQCSRKPGRFKYSSLVLGGRGLPQKVNSGHGICITPILRSDNNLRKSMFIPKFLLKGFPFCHHLVA